jgi:hypothetical protein
MNERSKTLLKIVCQTEKQTTSPLPLTYVKMKDVVKDGEENAQCRVRDSHLC